MRVKFQYNLLSDAKNWQRIISGNSRLSPRFNIKNIPRCLSEKLSNSSKEEGLEIIKEYLAEKNKNRDDLIKISLESLKMAWLPRENFYFQSLGNLLKTKIDFQNYQADLTTAAIAPYYWPDNWFMVSIYCSLSTQITNVAHEIFHIEFLRNYHKLLENLNINEKKAEIITEDITCLLNTDLFKGIIDLPDKGYEHREKTRNDIISRHKEGASLEDIVTMLTKRI